MEQDLAGKRKILVMVDWFWPGYKAGGPISAAINFVRHMRHDYEVYVFTGDRDLNATQAYVGIATNQWIDHEGAKVYYCSPSELRYRKIEGMIRELQPDFIYLNSLFSKNFTIYPLLLHRQGKIKAKLVIAPRGMLKASALQFKSFKKKLFLSLFRILGLHKGIFFQATDDTELKDIKTHFGARVQAALAADFPNQVPAHLNTVKKLPGEVSILFIGRIHPIKQLDYLLKIIQGATGNVLLTVTGDEEDAAYTAHCKKLAAGFPDNIHVVFTGGLPNHELPVLLAAHHFFALPTKGENFGHAIFEALSHGKPVLISDQTPWRQLKEQKAGWDLPLAKPDLFAKAIQQTIAMNQQEYDTWSISAWRFAKEYIERTNLIGTYKNLFN